MIRKCDICGREEDERWMYPFNTGRKTEWHCWDCYKNGQKEATMSDIQRGHRLYKISENRKMNK